MSSLRPPLPPQSPNTSMVLSLMLPSPTRPTRTDISALSRSLTPAFTSSHRRALATPATSPPLFSTPSASRISPLLPALVTSSVSTEQPSAFTTVLASSTPTSSTTAHGQSSLLRAATTPPSLTLESTTASKSLRPPLLPTPASGLLSTSPSTT